MKPDYAEMARNAWEISREGWINKDWFVDRARCFETFANIVINDSHDHLIARAVRESKYQAEYIQTWETDEPDQKEE